MRRHLRGALITARNFTVLAAVAVAAVVVLIRVFHISPG